MTAMKIKGEAINNLNKLLDSTPVQHGSPPPTDQQLADSHGPSCLCSHCQSMEPAEQANGELWSDSILNQQD